MPLLTSRGLVFLRDLLDAVGLIRRVVNHDNAFLFSLTAVVARFLKQHVMQLLLLVVALGLRVSFLVMTLKLQHRYCHWRSGWPELFDFEADAIELVLRVLADQIERVSEFICSRVDF